MATLVLLAVASFAVLVTSVVGPPSPPVPTDPAAAPTEDGAPAEDDLAAAPSQSRADAARDGVVPELAALPFAERVSVPDAWGTSRVATDEGVWVLSRLEPSGPAEGPARPIVGDRSGRQGRDFVVPGEYGEVLLLDAGETTILRAFPMPGLAPEELLVTEDAVYCARQGDGGLPYSLLCRIDTTTYDHLVRLYAVDAVDLAWLLPRPGWVVSERSARWFGPLVAAGDAIVAFGYDGGMTFGAYDDETLEPLPEAAVDVDMVFGTVVAADAGGDLVVDPARMLSGEEAAAAYEAATGDPGGPPNDYVIEDPDDATVAYEVADYVEVRMTLYWDYGTDEDFSKPLAWADFARIWAQDADTVYPAEDVAYARHGAYYWLTLVDGEVVWIRQQYLP